MRSGAGSFLVRLAPRSAWSAAAWFALLAVTFTWPVAALPGHTVPGDHGDPLLNCWILAWNADHLLRALGGDLAALGRIWHGNIFHPEPFTLGYSELLFAQAVQILPVYAATGNILLCYNLLLVSSYALSGLGMFLLVRQLTGDWRAAFVAGLVYGFLPYRVDQVPHLQTQSSQWMPFVLYGLRRHFDRGGAWPLAGAALAFVAQNLSCGYFLLYFSPFVPLYVLYEMAVRGRLRSLRSWAAVGATGGAVALGTLPFMRPYLAVRDLGLGTARDPNEVAAYAADVYAYLSAPWALNLWGGGRLQAFERPEGALFLGFTAMALALVGVLAGLREAAGALGAAVRPGAGHAGQAPSSPLRRAVAGLALAGLAVSAAALLLFAVTGGGRYRVFGQVVRMSSADRPALVAAVCAAALFLASPGARAAWRAAWTAPGRVTPPPLFFALCLGLAWWMSLGPRITLGGQPTGSLAIYGFFFEHVPGFDGLRVPARLAMVVGCFVAILAGYGAAVLLRRGDRAVAQTPHRAAAVTALLAGLVLAESAALPYPTDSPAYAGGGLRHPDRVVAPAAEAPRVYHHLAGLPRGTVVLLELPFGDPAWDIRHVYHAAVHWHPIVNGYSGYFPPSFMRRVALWRRPYRDQDAAWRAVLAGGITHIVVHGAAYRGSEEPAPDTWLTQRGARLTGTFGDDRLYAVGRSEGLSEEQDVGPRTDGGSQVDDDQHGDDAVDGNHVEEGAEGQGDGLGSGQGGAVTERTHQPRDEGIRLDRTTETLDSDVGERAVEHLATDECQDDQVAEGDVPRCGFSAGNRQELAP